MRQIQRLKLNQSFTVIYRYLCPFGWTQKKILEDQVYISAYSAVSTVHKLEEITNLCLSSYFVHWKNQKSCWCFTGGLGTDLSRGQEKWHLSEDPLCDVIQMGTWSRTLDTWAYITSPHTCSCFFDLQWDKLWICYFLRLSSISSQPVCCFSPQL